MALHRIASNSNVVSELLTWAAAYLTDHHIENPRLNAERLLGKVLGLERALLYSRSNHHLNGEELRLFRQLVARRARHEPLQYLLGETEFMSLPFKVAPGVLIPRPETEILVEKVLALCETHFASRQNISILDIGAGSGCIAVTLAWYNTRTRVTALDISDSALEIARKNAILNNVAHRIVFAKADFMGKSIEDEFGSPFDVVVANPPYVSAADFHSLPVEIRDHEPDIALQDYADGLQFYRRIAALAPGLVRKNGFIAVEVGAGQAAAVRALLAKSDCVAHSEIIPDLNGIDRVVLCFT